jgi:hypothetical protein
VVKCDHVTWLNVTTQARHLAGLEKWRVWCSFGLVMLVLFVVTLVLMYC